MTLTFDTSADFVTVVDGLEACTVKFPGSPTSTSVTHALRRAIGIREAEASGGRYTTSDVNWRFPQSECTTRPPLGSKIIDTASVYWTVLGVDDVCLRGEWRCVTRALEVVAGLDTFVRIQRAQFTKDAAGAAVSEFFDETTVKARIQEIGSTSGVESKLSMVRRTFEIILAEEVTIDSECQIVGPDGTEYQFDSYERAETIDSLPMIMASTDPWPNV
jgi:hypothetical protein